MEPEASQNAPPLAVEPESVEAAGGEGWRVTWRLRNLGDQPIELLERWVPHGRFRGEDRGNAGLGRLEPGDTRRLELNVRFGEPPGTVVENAFLVLRLRWRDRLWRLFARHRIEAGPGGVPDPICELVTHLPIGVSQPGP